MQGNDHLIGRYGRMHMDYLRNERPVLYQRLVLSGELYEHCAEVDEQAQRRFGVIMEQLAQAWSITEELKSCDQMGWVRMTNQAKHCAEENVVNEIIYA